MLNKKAIFAVSASVFAGIATLGGGAAMAQLDSYSEDAYAKPDYEGFEQTYNEWGQPDIGGVWSNSTTTRFERPERFGDKLVLSEEEALRVQQGAESYRSAGNEATDPDEGAPMDTKTALGYNRFWTDPGTQVMRIKGEPRSSLISTTKDGRVPPRRKGAPPAPQNIIRTHPTILADEGGNDNPEARYLSERCIFFPSSAGPVLRPVLYNNNFVFAQSPDAVAIVVEMIHTPKVIRLNAEHNEHGLLTYSGDAVGYWDGDTLVSVTKNYKTHADFFGASEQLTVTEKFTRVAENRLHYEFMVEDPVTWAEPWGGEYEFWKSNGFYEYACHEGNYGMEGILAGGRREEGDM